MRGLVDGLAFAEGPRWRDGWLWYSDMHRSVVERVALDGTREMVCRVPKDPSGLGWDAEGRLLVVSMIDRKILRQEPDGQMVVHADLSDLASFHCNDMVVDAHGRAYVGNFGFDLHGKNPIAPKPAELILVEADGSARVVDDSVMFPNGSVITPDGKTLIVAQTFAGDLIAYDLAPDGTPFNRRQWAYLNGKVPDGICLDAEGAVWFADPVHGGVMRVAEGGEVLDFVDTQKLAFACMLGGPEGRDLFICVANDSKPGETVRSMSGEIVVVEGVAVAGAGWP